MLYQNRSDYCKVPKTEFLIFKSANSNQRFGFKITFLQITQKFTVRLFLIQHIIYIHKFLTGNNFDWSNWVQINPATSVVVKNGVLCTSGESILYNVNFGHFEILGPGSWGWYWVDIQCLACVLKNYLNK